MCDSRISGGSGSGTVAGRRAKHDPRPGTASRTSAWTPAAVSTSAQ
jgi:hypothetical protein